VDQRPAFGFVPWLAFLRRALILRLLVFFDIRLIRLPAGGPSLPMHQMWLAVQARRSSAGQVLTMVVGSMPWRAALSQP
jgi:hypothetical protein